MVLKLHGHATPTWTRCVTVVLLEKQIPFEFVPVDFADGEQKSPEYLAKQPFGQVPYLDEGFILYESRAIARYIATKFAAQGISLIPTEQHANALFEQAASIETSDFDFFAARAVYEGVFKPSSYSGLAPAFQALGSTRHYHQDERPRRQSVRTRGPAPDQTVFDALIVQLSIKLDVYDKILSKQKYLAGNEITLADPFHLPYGSMLSIAGSNIIDTKPNVPRWFKELQARQSWQTLQEPIKSTA